MTITWMFLGMALVSVWFLLGRIWPGGQQKTEDSKKNGIPNFPSKKEEYPGKKVSGKLDRRSFSSEETLKVLTPSENPSGSSSPNRPESCILWPPEKSPLVRPVFFGRLLFKGRQAAFLREFIAPHMSVFKQQGAAPLLESVMELLESHGDCPSVVIDSRDQESKDLYTVRGHLAEVNLMDHSYTVAISLLRILKEKYIDYEHYVPKATITALAHDIGKIPEFRESGLYFHGREHTVTGAAKLKELACGMNIFWLNEAAKAVRDHHVSGTDEFTGLLRQADRCAREKELNSFAKAYSIKSFSQWFEPESYMRLIEPEINHLNSQRRWKAVSYKGVVYCFPEFIYQAARRLCKESKALDLTFMRESEKGEAVKLTVDALRKAGFVPDMLPEGRCAWKFELRSVAGKKRFMLTPLVWEGFDLEEIERRKAGFLNTVRVVRC